MTTRTLFLVALVLMAVLVPAVGATTLVVAAADATAAERAAADVRCDGIDDHRDINNAFNRLPGEAGTVRLTAGTFNCSESIFPTGNSALIGAGPEQTRLVVINNQSPYKPISVTMPDVHLRGFSLYGSGAVLVKESRVVVEEVTATSRGLDGTMYPARGNGMFYVWADGETIEDVAFIDCTVEDAHTHGFNLNAVNSPRETRNIRFINCVARGCGYGVAAGSKSEWVTGFDIQEDNDLYDVLVLNCVAEDNWQSGFHFEPGEDKGTIKKAITLTNCVARGNGQRNPATYPYTSTFLSGFYVHFNAAVTDCTSIDNRNAGFYVEGGDQVVFTRCTDRNSSYGWKIVKNVHNIRLEDCASYGAEEWALWSSYATNITLADFLQVDAVGGRGYQSMLGWYYDNPLYQQPVTGSSFEITASGNRSIPIINQPAGNVYTLRWEGDPTPTTTIPTITPTSTPSPGAPVAAFSAAPSQGRPPLNVSFTDRSTGVPTSWLWDFGDGAMSTQQHPFHVFPTEGLKTVNLTVFNELGMNTTTGYVTVGSAPFAAFSGAPRTVGAGQAVSFTDRSIGSPTAWSWSFGDGASSTARNPSHVYTASGLYTVRLTATYPGGSDTEQKTDYIRVVPDANFTANRTSGNAPLAVAFTDTSTGSPTVWTWEFGDGSNSTSRNPVHVYARAGTYNVSMTASGTYGGTTLARESLVTVSSSRPLVPFPGQAVLPRDLDGDGTYEDVNGNGRRDFADVTLFFNQLTWCASTEPVECFDFNGNGRIDFADAVWLFNRL
jgi:PKD repeat protein